MRDDTLGITEWCIYFFANLAEPHDCGRRSFLEQSNPARSSKHGKWISGKFLPVEIEGLRK